MAKFYIRFSFKCDRLKQQWSYMKLCCKSLTYNSIDSFAETAFEPLIYIVQFVVRWFGVVSINSSLLMLHSSLWPQRVLPHCTWP